MTSMGHNNAPLGDGWITRHRSVREHWLVGHGLQVKPADPSRSHCLSRGEAWEDLLMECRYEDGFVHNGGKKMPLERGSVLGAVSWLAARWNWTPQTVRTFLDKLEGDGMISRHVPGASESNKHVGKAAAIISVCNYDKYQRPDYADQQAEQQTSRKQATNEQQHNKDNKGTKEQEGPPTPKGGRLRYRDVARQAFDEFADLAQRCNLVVPTSFSDARAKAIIARMTEHAGDGSTPDEMLAVWRKALANIERSKFLRGMTEKNFIADLTFVLQAKSFTKLIEGSYGNGAHAPVARPVSAPSETPEQTAARLAELGYEFVPGDH